MNDDIFSHNRLILCHFDSYSTALLFPRYGTSVLLPSPLPDDASATSEAVPTGVPYDPEPVLQAFLERYALDASQLRMVDDFQEWMNTAEGPIRIHLAQFTTLDAPHDAMELHGGVFKPISQMRGTAMAELNLLRRAFNIFMGGN